MTDEDEPEAPPESLLEMEFRHAKERAALVERIRQDAYMSGLLDRSKPGNVDGATSMMERITSRVAMEYKVRPAEMRGPDRHKQFVEARWVAWAEMVDRGYSYPQIGRFFGRDHSTVMHGVRRAREMKEREERLK